MYRTSRAGGLAHIEETFTLDSPDVWSALSRKVRREIEARRGSDSGGGSQGRACGESLPPSFLGRHIVIHTEDGTAAACGAIGGELPGVHRAIVLAIPQALHSRSGDPNVSMLASFTAASFFAAASGDVGSGDAGVAMHAVLTGVTPRSSGTWAVHEGFACGMAIDRIGHVYPYDVGGVHGQAGEQPAGEWHADAHGNAAVTWEYVG